MNTRNKRILANKIRHLGSSKYFVYGTPSELKYLLDALKVEYVGYPEFIFRLHVQVDLQSGICNPRRMYFNESEKFKVFLLTYRKQSVSISISYSTKLKGL